MLREGQHDEEVLLMERSIRLEDPASGQISLPGGHVDPSDQTLRDTALRELREEIGLGPTDLAGEPQFVAVESAPRFGITVGVFAGRLAEVDPGRIRPDPQEVASVFWLPLRSLHHLTSVTRETRLGPAQVDAVVHESHVLWGFTLRVLITHFQ